MGEAGAKPAAAQVVLELAGNDGWEFAAGAAAAKAGLAWPSPARRFPRATHFAREAGKQVNLRVAWIRTPPKIARLSAPADR